MKKIISTAIIFLSIVIIGMFFIGQQEIDTEVTREQTTIGVLLNGTIQDKSWCQSHYEGIEKAAEELNLKVIYKENIPEDETSMDVMEELIAEGSKIIFLTSSGYEKWQLETAGKHPEIYFFQAGGNQQTQNTATYYGRIYQMRYLSGIVAGLQTETGQIGYVASAPSSEVNRGINAFALGVRLVNPTAEVHVEWCGSLVDDEKARAATERLFDHEEDDIDVMAMHTNSLEPAEVAEERGIWCIGYNMDNREDYPNSYLTAPIWNWEKFYGKCILECLQGKFKSKNYWDGKETELVSLTRLTDNVKEGIGKILEEEWIKIKESNYDVFCGPIYDTEGVLRVAEGENMPDSEMLYAFDWYVEGVMLHENH